MKMQKVEVEIPIFDGWEFYKPDQPEDLDFEIKKALQSNTTQKATIIPTPTGYIHKSSCSK